ncbi:peptidoglycan recognition protein family protein [Anaeromassilibacillus senegalensis]|uniref:peptidoglycan recognition protein family protein n=1 Tax=Anaeromassilibacillus senegalensis TaxID=1673717 RepID=UPI0006827538|nr:peptidoglycan recognition family protein [Anaeromassilibacillus senegalensis]
MNVVKDLLTINPYSRPGTKLGKVTKIAVHYVGNPGTAMQANRDYFESLKVGKRNKAGQLIYASSHYIVGLYGAVIQCIPETEISYATNQANPYSISIECCHPSADGKFTTAAERALVVLCADLCQRYKLDPLRDIIRHYDVTKKVCPKYYVDHPEAYEAFRQRVRGLMAIGIDTTMDVVRRHGDCYTVAMQCADKPVIYPGTAGVVTVCPPYPYDGGWRANIVAIGKAGESTGIYTRLPDQDDSAGALRFEFKIVE